MMAQDDETSIRDLVSDWAAPVRWDLFVSMAREPMMFDITRDNRGRRRRRGLRCRGHAVC
jgi:hypothetical protein